MAMKVSLNEFMGIDADIVPSAEVMTEKMTMDTLSDVYLRMKELGMNQKQLAKQMNITPSALSKLLSNGTNLRYSTVAKLAEALECDLVAPKLAPLKNKFVSESIGTTSSQMTYQTKVHACLNRTSTDDEYKRLCSLDREISVSEDDRDVSRLLENLNLSTEIGVV